MIQFETVTGKARTVGTLSLKPQSHVLRLHTRWGGLVLNRPVALLVDDGQQEERVPITDVTRVAQVTLLGAAGIFTLLARRAARRGGKHG